METIANMLPAICNIDQLLARKHGGFSASSDNILENGVRYQYENPVCKDLIGNIRSFYNLDHASFSGFHHESY